MEVAQALPDTKEIKIQSAVHKLHVPAWIVVLLLLITVTVPVGLFLMLRERCYHSWFPILLWICAGLGLLILAPFGIFVLPQLSTLYSTFGLSSMSSYVAYTFGVLLVIGQIVYGIILKKTYQAMRILLKKTYG